MIHPLLLCSHCHKQKPRLTPERAENYFLFCCQECKDAHEAEGIARRLKQMKTHDPAIRRVKTEGEQRAMGMILRMPRPSVDGETQDLSQSKHREHKKGAPKPIGKRPKKPRLCGKCGKPGHNARTCSRTKSAKKKASKHRQNKCGHCGKFGHNARTCPEK